MQIMDPSCVTRVLSVGPKKTGIASSRLGRLNKRAILHEGVALVLATATSETAEQIVVHG
jgi:anti-sigma regulatory factor (Ser/Thr protein kinase)